VIPDVLVILDAGSARRVSAAIRGIGRVAILLRDPALSVRALLETARRLRPEVESLLVSDRVDVALCSEADGVHLPERGLDPSSARRLLGAGKMIGASRHDPAGVRAAFEGGADWVTLSPIWPTPGKGPALGPIALASVAAAGPILALGGVDGSRTADAIAAGARGVAVVRAVRDAPDPAGALRAILASLDAARRALVDVAQ
jgi:thiamine-phosphate pyrophosphorylase